MFALEVFLATIVLPSLSAIVMVWITDNEMAAFISVIVGFLGFIYLDQEIAHANKK